MEFEVCNCKKNKEVYRFTQTGESKPLLTGISYEALMMKLSLECLRSHEVHRIIDKVYLTNRNSDVRGKLVGSISRQWEKV